MNGTGGQHVKQNKPDTERQEKYILLHISLLKRRKGTAGNWGEMQEGKRVRVEEGWMDMINACVENHCLINLYN
jgi:hypothetical protein